MQALVESRDALPCILANLAPAEQQAAASVSADWRQGASDALLSLRDLDLRGRAELTDDSLDALLARTPGLRSLNLAGCRALTDASLVALPARCARLERLNLACLPLLTASAASAAVEALPCLADLEIGGCFRTSSPEELGRRFGRFLEEEEDDDGLGACQG